MKTEVYSIDENNPPNTDFDHYRLVKSVKRENNGYALCDAKGKRLNFIPDGTKWLKRKQ
jgi:hypothetical protein